MSDSRLGELAKKYSVLYVEDEDDTRESVLRTLRRIGFANLYAASNGIEGLAIFKEKRPEIVISDIQMPVMNGLDMIKNISELDEHTHVLLTTAFSDSEYMMRSIELKIDKYITKPIEIDRLLDSIEDACISVEEKRLAEAYLQKEAKEKLELAINDTAKLIVDASPNAIVIFKNGKLTYVNDAFLEFLSHKDLSPIDRGEFPDVFEKKSGYMSSLGDYKDSATLENKACIKSQKDKDKIFDVRKKDVQFGDGVGSIYFFTDITLLEYQRRKLQLFGNAVQKELIGKRFEEKKKSENITTEKITLRKINAVEYATELDATIFEQLEELSELEREMYDDISLFSENASGISLQDFAVRLEKYSHTMKLLCEFEELSYAIKNMSELVYQKSSSIEPSQVEKISMYCSAILDDLVSWRSGIFVSKEVIDIHYLDDSLYSSCLQLEFEFKGVKLADEDNDLELF